MLSSYLDYLKEQKKDFRKINEQHFKYNLYEKGRSVKGVFKNVFSE